jgi:membrane protease YdiL (CAAX protease family)
MSDAIPALISHVIAGLLVVVAPLLAYRRARRATGDVAPGAKVRRFRWLVVRQVLTIAIIAGWWAASGLPAGGLGLGAPFSWWMSLGGVAIVVALMARSAVALRKRADELRDKMRSRAGALLLPESNDEARWFILVSLFGGIAEELGYRGFLFSYALVWFPAMNSLELVLATSICFGIAHVYQGWRGVVATTAAGLLMGVLYVATGNLLLPVVTHVLGNMRAVVIFWTPTRDRA